MPSYAKTSERGETIVFTISEACCFLKRSRLLRAWVNAEGIDGHFSEPSNARASVIKCPGFCREGKTSRLSLIYLRLDSNSNLARIQNSRWEFWMFSKSSMPNKNIFSNTIAEGTAFTSEPPNLNAFAESSSPDATTVSPPQDPAIFDIFPALQHNHPIARAAPLHKIQSGRFFVP